MPYGNEGKREWYFVRFNKTSPECHAHLIYTIARANTYRLQGRYTRSSGGRFSGLFHAALRIEAYAVSLPPNFNHEIAEADSSRDPQHPSPGRISRVVLISQGLCPVRTQPWLPGSLKREHRSTPGMLDVVRKFQLRSLSNE